MNRSSPRWVAVIALAAAGVRLPFLGLPLSSDEAGYLTVAAQWGQGHSLYGDYWVDRPPLLLAWYAAAGRAAGLLPHVDPGVALRLVGVAAAVAAVVLAGVLGRLADRSTRGAVLGAGVCAVLVSSPLLDMSVVDGELLTLPAVLGALVLTEVATTAGSARTAAAAAVAAGALGMAGPLVKQNAAGGLLVLAVASTLLVLRGHRHRAVLVMGSAALGASAVLGGTVLWAATRGTDPAALWDAVVAFRGRASEVIAGSASAATPERARRLLLAALGSGAPAVLLLLGRARTDDAGPTPRPDPMYATPTVLALLGWEVVGVLAGGSYWLHYLVGLVPALSLVVAAYCHRTRDLTSSRLRWRRPVLLLAPLVASLVVSLGIALASPRERPVDDRAAVAYLRAHGSRGSTGVVAFGNPALLRAAGMSSPYADLWSLPVRVRDPHLRRLTRLLRDPSRAPQWVVQYGDSLGSWGLDAHRADPVLQRRYRHVATFGDLEVFRRGQADR
ncbi:hypothetical protein [uncultured Nocardioides sp.]|uniref:hypothetical protein n=1 Tax=uncultured Nocardioides sp. TaxID=198441 RepID=UPI000C41DE0F|nr:hypothetical protein [uncultured Nocardioides sp.]MAO79631.1 hypothetical protein [Nocardioides sp.]